MNEATIKRYLDVLKFSENLKKTLRSAHLSNGRVESTADHTWRLLLWILLFKDEMNDINLTRLYEMAIIHDLGEAISGDIPAPNQKNTAEKHEKEQQDLETLLAPLPLKDKTYILELWHDYEAAKSIEAQWLKALDKLETMLQHNQGKNPPDFDYHFNLSYGQNYTDTIDLLKKVRHIIDSETLENSQRV